MRTFPDENGRHWVASTGFRPGPDYQGRHFLIFRPAEAAEGEGEAALPEVQWNSEKTARRTLETMSEVELRRRLRNARGRAVPQS